MIIMSICLLSEISSSVRIALTKQVPRPCTVFLPSSNIFCFHVVPDHPSALRICSDSTQILVKSERAGDSNEGGLQRSTLQWDLFTLSR